MFDCLIIGGGVIGCSILKYLSDYNLNCALLEKGEDVGVGASRANSGIIHAGYDCKPGTLKAKLNVRGNKLYEQSCRELKVDFKKIGSLVVSDEKGLEEIKKLEIQGILNGVNVSVIERKEILKIEPNVASNIKFALYAPDAGIVCPYKYTIALAEHALLNGQKIFTDCLVKGIEKNKETFKVKTDQGDFECKILVNSAGTHCMEINEMAGAEVFPVSFRRGEYFVLDAKERRNIHTVLFPLPDEKGKGILVAPTVDGNVLYGPTSIKSLDMDDTKVTKKGLEQIKESIGKTYKSAHIENAIRAYAGNRCIVGDDFIIKESETVKNFIMLLGICSPGLTAAPAIGESVSENIVKKLNSSKKDRSEIVFRDEKIKASALKRKELKKLIKEDDSWGREICHCEKVTEHEIVDAIHSILPARSFDAVKRRLRTGMGRCQGENCYKGVAEILSRELSIPIEEIKSRDSGGEKVLKQFINKYRV